MSYHAAKRSQNDVHKSNLGNVALICINRAFNKLKATRLATEILYDATKRHWNEDHKAKLRTVVLCSRSASSKLRGFQQKCPIVTLSKSQAARVATDAFFFYSASFSRKHTKMHLGPIAHGKHNGLLISYVTRMVRDGHVPWDAAELVLDVVFHHGSLRSLNNRHLAAIKMRGAAKVMVRIRPLNPSLLLPSRQGVLQKWLRANTSTVGGWTIQLKDCSLPRPPERQPKMPDMKVETVERKGMEIGGMDSKSYLPFSTIPSVTSQPEDCS